jgi:hypothetical protein
MGRWLLLDEPMPVLPEEAGRVVVQPNFRIFAFDPIADRILAQLDTFATRLNAERAIEYEITRDTVYRAMLGGQSVESIKSWLVKVSGNPIPQNVERSLDEWQAAYDRITIRRHVAVIQAASPELLDSLLANQAINAAILGRLSPTLAMADAAKVDAVEQALLELDELPVRASRAGEIPPGILTVDDQGDICFAHGQPNLYAQGRLHNIVEATDAGWRVTAASVHRAQTLGLDAQGILSTLRQLTGAEPPPALTARIKAWSRHYGDANLRTITLVEFQDQATLEELLADPELKPYLTPFKPGVGLGLATVEPTQVETLKRLLAARGVSVQ